MHLVENRDYGRCSLVTALKAVLERVNVENTIFTKIGYPLRQEREMINSIAMREAVINAIVHNDYSYGGVPKVEFFSDRVEVTAMGGLPYGLEAEDFFNGGSIPRNKEIMRIFRDLEIVEHLGSGILRIVQAYNQEVFEIRKSFIRVILPYEVPIDGAPEQVTEQVTEQVMRLLACFQSEPLGTKKVMESLGLLHRPTFLYQYLQPALDAKLLELTQPESPRSPTQKYRLTEKGRVILKNRGTP